MTSIPYTLSQLAAFCRAYPIAPKVLIAPALAVGNSLAAALAASGHAWANLHIHTPRSLAVFDAEAHLISEGWTRLSQDADIFLLDALIPDLVRNHAGDDLAEQASGLTRSFLRTLHALRAAGVEADHFASGNALLQGIYRAYCDALARMRGYDTATLYRRAIAHLKTHPPSTDIHHIILDETLLTALACEYLRLRAGGTLHRIGRPDCGVQPPPHSAACRFAECPTPETACTGPGTRLITTGLSPGDADRIHLRETLGVETEIRAIFRDMREKNLAFGDIEIAYTTPNPYLPLLCDIIAYCDIPATFAAGKPISLTRTGQAIISYYRWIGSGFDVEELIGMCRAGLIHSEGITPHALASLLRRSGIREGRHCADALARLTSPTDDDLDTPNETHIEAAQRVLNRLFAPIPDGTPSLQAMIDAGLAFLSECVDGETEVCETLRDMLRNISTAMPHTGPVRRMASRLVDMLSGQTFDTQSARPGCISIAPLGRAGYAHRPHLYIVGMNEGAFPGGIAEDPLLLDDERAALSGELALQRTRPAEQVWHLLRVLDMAPGHITLSSTRKTLSDGRESYPSALFQQAAEHLGMERAPILYPISDRADLALDDAEGLLASQSAPNFAEKVAHAFPDLSAGLKAYHARAWPGLTPYDGYLGHPTPELAIGPEHDIYSPSRLETLARCPHRYFLRYVLGINPPEEVQDDPTHWLDPLAFGLLLHRVFRTFMETITARGELPHRERHDALLQDVLVREITAAQTTHPVQHQAAFRADVRRLERAAQVFLAVESDQPIFRPVGFEISFGFGQSGGLNREHPVLLRLSNDVQFRIRGRIDRVDQIEENYAIWDYKTGSMAQYDERDLLKRGAHLQWVLYAYALDAILKDQSLPGQVRQSGYFFPGDREHGRKLVAPPPEPDALAHVLRPLFQLVANGGFFHIQKERECTYCPYHRLCADERIDAHNLDAIREAMRDDAAFAPLLDGLNRWMGI